MQDLTNRRFSKLDGLFRIEELGLPHPDWKFVSAESQVTFRLDPHLRSRVTQLGQLKLSREEKWTVRTCLVGGEPKEEYGLKRAVGILSDKVGDNIAEFNKYYEVRSLYPVFVVYPYFSASKSGIVELHRNEHLIEAVEGSQWRLTEEGAPSESWQYRGLRETASAVKFEQGPNRETRVLNMEELGTLVNLVAQIPENDVLLEWTYTPDGKLLFYDMRSVAPLGPSGSTIIERPPDLIGNGASPGIVTGRVRVSPVDSMIDHVKPGEILVFTTLTKNISTLIPKLPPNTGIISGTGGVTSHPAIVSREFGVPMIVGLKEAPGFFKDGQVVTMDGATGRVYFAERPGC